MSDPLYVLNVTMPANTPIPHQLTSVHGEFDDAYPDHHDHTCTYEWRGLAWKKAFDMQQMAKHYQATSAEIDNDPN